MAFRNQALNGETVTSGIRSDNYVFNVDGWRLAREGAVHFAGGKIQLEVDGIFARLAMFKPDIEALGGSAGGVYGQTSGIVSLAGAGFPGVNAPEVICVPDDTFPLSTRVELKASDVLIGNSTFAGLPGTTTTIESELTTVEGRFNVLGALGTELQDSILAILAGLPHHERNKSSGAQSIPDATRTAVTWPDLVVDRGDISLDVALDTFTINTDGKYLIGGSVAWATNVTGRRLIDIQINGASAGSSNTQAAQTGNHSNFFGGRAWDLVAGDTVQIDVEQNSGAALNVGTNSHISISRIG